MHLRPRTERQLAILAGETDTVPPPARTAGRKRKTPAKVPLGPKKKAQKSRSSGKRKKREEGPAQQPVEVHPERILQQITIGTQRILDEHDRFQSEVKSILPKLLTNTSNDLGAGKLQTICVDLPLVAPQKRVNKGARKQQGKDKADKQTPDTKSVQIQVMYGLQYKGSMATGLFTMGSDVDMQVMLTEFRLERDGMIETDIKKLRPQEQAAIWNALIRHLKGLMASEEGKKKGYAVDDGSCFDMSPPTKANPNPFALLRVHVGGSGMELPGIDKIELIGSYDAHEDEIDALVGYIAREYPVIVRMKAVVTSVFKLLGAMGAENGGHKSVALAWLIVEFLSWRGVIPDVAALVASYRQRSNGLLLVSHHEVPELCRDFIKFYDEIIIQKIAENRKFNESNKEKKTHRMIVVRLEDVRKGHAAVAQEAQVASRILSLRNPLNEQDDLTKSLKWERLDGIALLAKWYRAEDVAEGKVSDATEDAASLVDFYVRFLGVARVGSLELLGISSECGDLLRAVLAQSSRRTRGQIAVTSPGGSPSGKKRKVAIVTGNTTTSKNPKQAARQRANAYYDTFVVKCTLNPMTIYAVATTEIRDCAEMLSKLFYHVHRAMLQLISRSKGQLLWKGKPVDGDSMLQSYWNGMACAMYRCLCGMERGTTDKTMYEHCLMYCQEGKVPRDWPNEPISWRAKPREQMAKQSSDTHATHLTTNFHIYLNRYMHVVIANDGRFATIKERKTSDYNKIVAAVTYGDTDAQQMESIQTIIARRPSTRKEFDDAQKAIKKAIQMNDKEALEKAELKKADALHPDHQVWAEAETLRGVWRKYAKKGTYSQVSERLYSILPACREFGAVRQEQAIKAAKERSKGVDVPRRTGPLAKKMKWTFSLCPVMEYGPKYVHFTTTAIKDLFEELAKKHSHIKEKLEAVEAEAKELVEAKAKEPVETEESVRAKAEELVQLDVDALYWHALFNVKRGLGNKEKYFADTKQLRFANAMSTDGVGVSIHISRRKSEKQCELVALRQEIKEKEAEIKARLPTLSEAITLEELKTKAKDMANELKPPENHEYEVSPQLKEMLDPQLEMNEDGSITVKPGKHKVKGIDPGKKAIGTVAAQTPDGKHEIVDMPSGEWIYITGQKQHTKKMTKRIKEGCPEWLECPSVKTEVEADLIAAFKHCSALLPKMDELLFKDLWLQKQKMRKFVKRQRALETLTARFCGTTNKVEQKNVVIALGDADLRGNIRGLPPVASKAWVKHIMHCAIVVLVNEFRTSLLCSKCHKAMHQQSECFRVKRCLNSDCSRSFWNRDVNAAINILDLFLWAAFGEPGKSGWCSGTSTSRPKAFRKTKQLDE